MRIVAAMDSFKGSLSSMQAGRTVQNGINKALSDACTVVKPLADGREGTVRALIQGMHGIEKHIAVSDPVDCIHGILPDQTDVIEMAGQLCMTRRKVQIRNFPEPAQRDGLALPSIHFRMLH